MINYFGKTRLINIAKHYYKDDKDFQELLSHKPFSEDKNMTYYYRLNYRKNRGNEWLEIASMSGRKIGIVATGESRKRVFLGEKRYDEYSESYTEISSVSAYYDKDFKPLPLPADHNKRYYSEKLLCDTIAKKSNDVQEEIHKSNEPIVFQRTSRSR